MWRDQQHCFHQYSRYIFRQQQPFDIPTWNRQQLWQQRVQRQWEWLWQRIEWKFIRRWIGYGFLGRSVCLYR